MNEAKYDVYLILNQFCKPQLCPCVCKAAIWAIVSSVYRLKPANFSKLQTLSLENVSRFRWEWIQLFYVFGQRVDEHDKRVLAPVVAERGVKNETTREIGSLLEVSGVEELMKIMDIDKHHTLVRRVTHALP
jgi:hypothetical protein